MSKTSANILLDNWTSKAERPIHALCLGRAGMDLYATDYGASLGQTSMFHQAVGGSPANIAFGLNALGANAGVISCVSNDGVGHFVLEALEAANIMTDFVTVLDGETRTSLALAEYTTSPEVVIYRNNAADLQLAIDHVKKVDFNTVGVLVVSGTALSTSPSVEATLYAMKSAVKAGCKVVLDLDYRAYSWRDDAHATQVYQTAAEHCDVLIGNEEEFQVLSGAEFASKESDTVQTLADMLLQGQTELVIAKAGEKGCCAYGLNAMKHLTSVSQPIFRVDARKPYGAGDAFASALIYGLINNHSLNDALAMGAANAAINVTKTTCSTAMATRHALSEFMHLHHHPIVIHSPNTSHHTTNCHKEP